MGVDWVDGGFGRVLGVRPSLLLESLRTWCWLSATICPVTCCRMIDLHKGRKDEGHQSRGNFGKVKWNPDVFSSPAGLWTDGKPTDLGIVPVRYYITLDGRKRALPHRRLLCILGFWQTFRKSNSKHLLTNWLMMNQCQSAMPTR